MTKYLDYKLEGKRAIVTGGGTGIGEACAVELAKGGASVALFGRREGPLQNVLEKCRAYSAAMAVPMDVSDEKSVAEAVSKVIGDFGGVDILINNAGIDRKVEVGEFRFEKYFGTESAEEYMKYLAVNALGHYLMNNAVIPYMRENHFGRIVNISSVLALSGFYSTPPYTASKGASLTQTKAYAQRYGRDGITVNAILPGMIDTPMKADSPPEEYDMVKSMTPLGRVGQPLDVAKLALFLCQEDLFITGEGISVTGGA
ncbi:MAG: SDR family oxidoreductase [Clostridiales Family XIII bacterium]|jgi:NAD(P)-dependent dehydrogenase (short-subunit alcohol dehydrogenase family)|nr:SDR family oxidoreductase [Clostridiales Family XIII bacterium]